MRIDITLNENKYAIEVEGNCYTAIKYGINDTKDSKNFGEQTSKDLGYFNKLSNACLRLCREELASSPDTVSLKQFANRVEDLNKQLANQLNFLEDEALKWLKTN